MPRLPRRPSHRAGTGRARPSPTYRPCAVRRTRGTIPGTLDRPLRPSGACRSRPLGRARRSRPLGRACRSRPRGRAVVRRTAREPDERAGRRLLLRRGRERADARGFGAGFRRPGPVLRRRDPAASWPSCPGAPRTGSGCGTVPLHLGRPVWVDDDHFQILYHVRHTAVPAPGGAEQLRNLAGRVFAQRLDLSKPLWEVWLVEGLEGGRWALISKVHHCMVDGVAGTDIMQRCWTSSPRGRRCPEPARGSPSRALDRARPDRRRRCVTPSWRRCST